MNHEILNEARRAVEYCFSNAGETLFDSLSLQLANWMEVAAQSARNAEFYRHLLLKCAEQLRPDVFISDDGSIQDEPLMLKVPELVQSRVELLFDVGRALMAEEAIPEKAWRLWVREDRR